MFLKLFGSIRNNGVPVTLREYLDLLEGLSKGLCSSNKIEDFYNYSKLCLVKDEKNYDKFDKAFNSFYEENKNIINHVEKKIPESCVFQCTIKIFLDVPGFLGFRGPLQAWPQPPPDFPDSYKKPGKSGKKCQNAVFFNAKSIFFRIFMVFH